MPLDERLRISTENLTALNKTVGQLKEFRREVELDFLDIQEFQAPATGVNLPADENQKDMTDPKQRRRRTSLRVIDNVAQRSLEVSTSGLKSGVVPESFPWFRYSLQDRDRAKFGPNSAWLSETTETVLRILSSSNFYLSYHDLIREYIAYDIGAMGMFKDDDSIIYNRHYTAGEYWIGHNDKFEVDTFYREIWLYANQIKDRFGEDAMSVHAKSLLIQNQGWSPVLVSVLIEPRRHSVFPLIGGEYTVITWETASHENKLLDVTPFEEFPIIVPRGHAIGPKMYGYSLGMDVMGLTKILQRFYFNTVEALEKELRPPMRVPTTYHSDLDMSPNATNLIDELPGSKTGVEKLFEFQFNTNDVRQMIEDIRQRIREGFHTDLFSLLINNPPGEQTAFEVATRNEEKIAALSPFLERQHTYGLKPAITRAFNIAQERGMIREPPPDLDDGTSLDIVYTGTLSQAQQLVGLENIERLMAFTGRAASVDPGVVDKIDLFKAVEEYGHRLNVIPEIVRDAEQVREIQERRQQLEEQKAALEQLNVAAQGAKTLSETPIRASNALEEILG